ncbi:MAG TPA: DUF5668 domain-containing protein, partial [Terriglobales bacterium]
MAPAVLITLGILFLLQETGVSHFNQTWPLLFIVIGVVQIVKRSAPTEAHVERGYEAYMAAQQQAAARGPVVTPTPAPNAGELPPPSSSEEAHNG